MKPDTVASFSRGVPPPRRASSLASSSSDQRSLKSSFSIWSLESK
jgi:hypothetical protein